MRESPALRIRALRKRYAKFEALREVDLDVGAGEAFGLVGANGAGQDDAHQMPARTRSMRRGTIEIFGVAARESGGKARLAYLPERFNPRTICAHASSLP